MGALADIRVGEIPGLMNKNERHARREKQERGTSLNSAARVNLTIVA